MNGAELTAGVAATVERVTIPTFMAARSVGRRAFRGSGAGRHCAV